MHRLSVRYIWVDVNKVVGMCLETGGSASSQKGIALPRQVF